MAGNYEAELPATAYPVSPHPPCSGTQLFDGEVTVVFLQWLAPVVTSIQADHQHSWKFKLSILPRHKLSKSTGCSLTLTLRGFGGEGAKKAISRRRKEGRVEKKARAAPRGEGPQLHAMGVV